MPASFNQEGFNMDYRYTDTDETPVVIKLTLADIRRMRRVFAAVIADDSAESLVVYAAQDYDKALRKCLEGAVNGFELEAATLKRRLENGEL